MSQDRQKEIAAAIERRLARLFDDPNKERGTGIFTAVPSPFILDQVRELTMRGGKRLRGVLVACGAALFDGGEVTDRSVLDAAAAMELLHTYFLIHDDIMDEDDTRRGGPSAHVALAAASGDEKLGRDLAILCGDLAAALHERLLAGLPAPADRKDLALRLFAEMHLDVIHGQTLDLLGAADAEVVANRKTASYTTVGPLVVGAALGGGGEADILRIAEIGRPLGVAFQLRDDLLGVFGRSAITGKPVGTDLKNGKRTFLVQEAARLGGDDHRRAVEAALADPDPSTETIDAAVEALESSGARDACQRRIDELLENARALVAAGPYREAGKALLIDMAGVLGRRDR